MRLTRTSPAESASAMFSLATTCKTSRGVSPSSKLSSPSPSASPTEPVLAYRLIEPAAIFVVTLETISPRTARLTSPPTTTPATPLALTNLTPSNELYFGSVATISAALPPALIVTLRILASSGADIPNAPVIVTGVLAPLSIALTTKLDTPPMSPSAIRMTLSAVISCVDSPAIDCSLNLPKWR